MTLWKRLALLESLIVIALDQLTKYLVLHSHAIPDHGRDNVTSFFALVRWWNRGVSFGMLNGLNTPELQRTLLMFLTLGIVMVLFYALFRAEKRLTMAALGLIIGGAFGNLIDRVLYGAVADFLYFHWHQYDFPAFNLADSCVVTGVGLLMLQGLGLGRDRSASFIDTKDPA